jgi:hypothetical protein
VKVKLLSNVRISIKRIMEKKMSKKLTSAMNLIRNIAVSIIVLAPSVVLAIRNEKKENPLE